MSVRPLLTLAVLRLIWLAILLPSLIRIGYEFTWILDQPIESVLQRADTLDLEQLALFLMASPFRLLAQLALYRIALEIAVVLLVPTPAEAASRNWLTRAFRRLFVLGPFSTQRWLQGVWIAFLVTWIAFVILTAPSRLDAYARALGEQGQLSYVSVYARFVLPVLAIVNDLVELALARGVIEVATRVLPHGSSTKRKKSLGMNILLIGSGGREHALAWKLAQSPRLAKLYAAPGNPGIAECADIVALDVADHDAVARLCRDKQIDLVVVGPEAPLVAGLVDALAAFDIPAFGPSAAAAALEGSKGFTKDLCAEAGIPTAAYGRFTDAEAAKAYAREQGAPIVVKADGLAAGKGVTVAATIDEALAAIDDCFAGAFGEAGAEVVVEECLVGEEASFFALTDGETVLPLATAQDHKRVGEGDTGPNTGGMGAYSPAPIMTPELVERTLDEIIRPTVKAMRDRGTPFQGVLYAGLMITDAGPKLIEYNVRFGDPETQPMMMRLDSDLVDLLYATATGGLSGVSANWREESALTVVMAAQGYPGAYAKGSAIDGIGAADGLSGVKVFQAGTGLQDGRLVANGGRVLNVTATGATIAEAQALAYEAVDRIVWPEGFCRRDIGWRAISDRGVR
ncbi:phosphoribosylamine--glycine ligase [Bauldia litoralis]|uniref:Phosphoribosylamine--glycine ligase n=2 Tax=Bauldia litoralis TaxID=665467 RepID=A0A1G6C5J2_9HYPH|nr:phosphoribosylamine--glycine ligase [Bauldia litoralis]